MNSNQPQDHVAPHPVLEDYYTDPAERREAVDAMFDASAVHYDWITDMMSFGSGRWYRRQALVRAGVSAGDSLLDVGAGTGVVSWLAQQIVGENGHVVALDPSKGMLGEATKLGVKNVTQGYAEAIPFPDNSFDWVTMGYALRHVESLEAAFAEYKRVLKPGGRVLLLEIGRPATPLSTALLKVYMKGFVPNVARVFRRSEDAKKLMRYYWDTIEQCVAPETIVSSMEQVGFEKAHCHVVMGIFKEYSAVKPLEQ